MMAENPNSNEAKAKLVEEGRAFFCSELVIKAYKLCGIMQQTNEACSNFLPVDLTSSKNKINLVNGATLGEEQLIFTETMFTKVQKSRENNNEAND